MVEKIYLTAQGLLEDSFKLGHIVMNDGFRPDYIIGIWRGGTPVGIAVQELLEYHGISTDHIAIRTSSYDGIDKQRDRINVYGLNYIIDNANEEDSLLIVDDVFDSGRSIEATIARIRELSRRNTPHDIRTATVYYKPNKRKVDLVPNYYVHKTDEWLVFPHEICGLTEEEIREHKSIVLDRD